jgi:hypothetical protein
LQLLFAATPHGKHLLPRTNARPPQRLTTIETRHVPIASLGWVFTTRVQRVCIHTPRGRTLDTEAALVLEDFFFFFFCVLFEFHFGVAR